jgi:hypothetical protein
MMNDTYNTLNAVTPKPMSTKPINVTVREVKVVLNSLGYSLYHDSYNDQRVNGGRIKFFCREDIRHVMGEVEERLEMLFPDKSFRVSKYKGAAYTIHWNQHQFNKTSTVRHPAFTA